MSVQYRIIWHSAVQYKTKAGHGNAQIEFYCTFGDLEEKNAVDLGIPYCCLDVDTAFILLIIWAFESKNDVHLELQV